MDIPSVNITEKNAEKLYDDYSLVLKERADELTAQARKEAEQLKSMAWHAKNGRRIIDIRKVMKQSDVNEARLPRLAIVPITAKKCYYFEQERGAGKFSPHDRNWHAFPVDVIVPIGTFPLPTEAVTIRNAAGEVVETRQAQIHDRDLLRASCDVPTIPAALQPRGDSDKYILFEVERWQVRNLAGRQSRDPMLLQRINANMFVVLAAWDLTELEASVLK